VRADNGSSGTNADECDNGPHLSDNSVTGLVLMSDFSMCVQAMVPVGRMLTSVIMALTCPTNWLLA
jgi:hypothetical protein